MNKNYSFRKRGRAAIGGYLGCVLFALMLLLTNTPGAQAQSPTGLTITLDDLGYNDVALSWRVSSAYYAFGLPTNWQPVPGNYILLDLDYATNGQLTVPARVEIQFNNTVIHNEIFTTSAGRQIRVEIPTELIRAQETRYLNDMLGTLTINEDCEENQLTSLTVRASSLFFINYTERPLSLDLSRYPQPLYQRSALTSTVTRFVLPPAPDATELQSALMVAAKLGELTDNRLVFASSSTAELPAPTIGSEHLMVVGKPESNALIRQLQLPVPLAERQLELSSTMPATVALGQPFNYTVRVKNTAAEEKTLRIEDVWPPFATIEEYPAQCRQVAGAVRCDLGSLKPGEEVSKIFTVRVEGMDWLGQPLEHTASLLDNNGQVLNVDTLQSGIGLEESPDEASSELPKAPYFFVYQNRGVSENDGIIQATYSPWSPRHIALVVTGVTDEALLKAGEALATQAQFPGMSGSQAFVQAVQPVTGSEVISQAHDISLASLGYEDEKLSADISSLQYNFYIPRGWALVSDASLDLHTSHSAALAAMSSTLQVYMNQIPIYSTLITPQNAENAWRNIAIPARRMAPGVNRLSFELSGRFPECLDQRFAKGLWLVVYADTTIHIPHATMSTTVSLKDFPHPFSEKRDLSNVIFVLPESLNAAESVGVLRLAAALGAAGGGERIRPQVLMGVMPDEEARKASHIVAIGEPTRNPLVATLGDLLPQPFITGTNQIRQQVDDVIYRLPPDYSLGFVQELPSPWNRERALLVVTGSTSEGVSWALEALTDEALSRKLDGNLATIVKKGEMRVTDTRGTPEPYAQTTFTPPTLITTMTPEATLTPLSVSPTPTPTPAITATPRPGATTSDETTPTAENTPAVKVNTRPIWMAPLLVLSLIAVVVIVWLALRQAKSN